MSRNVHALPPPVRFIRGPAGVVVRRTATSLPPAQVRALAQAWRQGTAPASVCAFLDEVRRQAKGSNGEPTHEEVVAWLPPELLGELENTLPAVLASAEETATGDQEPSEAAGDGKPAASLAQRASGRPPAAEIRTASSDKRKVALARMAQAMARWEDAQEAAARKDDAVQLQRSQRDVARRRRMVTANKRRAALVKALTAAFALAVAPAGGDLLVGGPTAAMLANAQGGQFATKLVLNAPVDASSLQEHTTRQNAQPALQPPAPPEL